MWKVVYKDFKMSFTLQVMRKWDHTSSGVARGDVSVAVFLQKIEQPALELYVGEAPVPTQEVLWHQDHLQRHELGFFEK